MAYGKDVGGPITSDTTFTENESPFDVKLNLLVIEGVTLTIEPGVVLRFEEGNAIQIDGELVAHGTALKPIVFTSSMPDGNWVGIIFTGTAKTAIYDVDDNYESGSIMESCTIEKIKLVTFGAITCQSSAPFINNCLIQDNDNTGIYILHSGLIIPTVIISNNTITNNSGKVFGAGITIDGGGSNKCDYF